MVTKYVYGTPFETDAVVKEFPNASGDPARLSVDTADGLCITCLLEPDAPVFGLGETLHGINKRGNIYVSNCTDDPTHTEEKLSLYAAHNFLLIGGKTPFGIFIDAPQILRFDIGFTKSEELRITSEKPDIKLYVIEGESFLAIVREFRSIIGQSYIPPFWAFGYQQSRWGYASDTDVETVAKRHRDAGVALDSVYMDIDYMVDYKDFTVDETKYPHFKDFVQKMRDRHIHLVPIIDAGVKVEKGYSVYEEGVKKGYFCKDKDGREFSAVVWPGNTHFPDVLNPEARYWFGEQYKFLLAQGIDGFWNDMNEPAIFYTDGRLHAEVDRVTEFGKQSEIKMGQHWIFSNIASTLPNNPADYASFYHNVNGKPVCHTDVHNLFGYNMTRAAGESFERNSPDKRILLFSRSSYIGMHRYGGIWTGDNTSWWSHLALNVRMMPSLNMCGFLYSGADIGGFCNDSNRELLMRWLQFGIFTPLMRNHTTNGSRNQEVYNFERVEDFARIISIRYALIPYLYSEFVKASLRDEMLFRPLCFDYPDDPATRDIEDQLMFGEGLMLTPVIQQNARSRNVYLPEDMVMVRAKSGTDFTLTSMQKGLARVEVPLDEMVFFLKKDHILPLCKPALSTAELDPASLTLLGEFSKECAYELYTDDGVTRKICEQNIVKLQTAECGKQVTL